MEEKTKEERAKRLTELIEELHQGTDYQKVKQTFLDEFKSVSPNELAEAEGEVIASGVPVSEVQNLCDLHAAAFQDGIKAAVKARYHEKKVTPISVLQEENKGLRRLLTSIKTLLNAPESTEEIRLAHDLTSLGGIGNHYAKKENFLFPYLNQLGISAPPKVMWGVDDEIRGEYRALLKKMKNGASPHSLKEEILPLLEKIGSMIDKEEKILFPMVEEAFAPWMFDEIAEEMPEAGYVFLFASPDPEDYALSGQKKPASPLKEGTIDLGTGKLSLDVLIPLLNSLGAELTFLDEEDRFRYYNKPKEKVFLRTKGQLDEPVESCHPVSILPQVKAILSLLKSGAKDQVEMMFPKGEMIVYNRYLAVRDSKGKYLGCLEVTENVKPILELAKKA